MTTSHLDAAIVGAQKCGTTALATFLGEHPDVAVPIRKELHAFDDEDHDWQNPDLETLIDDFFVDQSPHALRLDATPITMYWPNAVERLAAHCPDIRCIVLLRDPVMRAWSHWRMEVSRGNDTLDFSTAIRDGRDRVTTAGGHHRVYSYVERGFYARQLDRLRKHVAEERILIVRQVDLLLDHHGTLRRVLEFLDLDPEVRLPAARRVFSHDEEQVTPMTDADRHLLRRTYAADLAQLAHDYGLRLPTES